MGNHVIHLLGTHRLPVLTQVKMLTVYHVSYLLRTHTSSGRCKTIDYSFLYLHIYKFIHFYRNINLG